MAAGSIAVLPIELLVFVIESLDRVRDIAALARTNRRLYSTANPLLYERAARNQDARPLAWAASRGLVGTLRMVLAAGADPNRQFVEQLPAAEWEKACAPARAAAPSSVEHGELFDFEGGRDSSIGWSTETDNSDHAGTPETAQSLSRTASGHSLHALSGSDQESDISTDGGLSSSSEPSVSDPGTVNRTFYAIHLAASRGHDEIIEILIDHGALVNVPSERFCACTPLYGLLNATEQPETDRPPPTWSPLHAAICHSHSQTAKLLLSHGASHMMELSITTTDGCPRPTGHGATALHHAAAMGLADLVQHLVIDRRIQPDIDVRDDRTLTPFYHAYAHRRWDSTVPLLRRLGADVDVEVRLYIPYAAITPLGEACRLGDFAEADRLLDLGADVARGFVAATATATKTAAGCLTPLHMCCMRSAQPIDAARRRQNRAEEEEETGGSSSRTRTIEKLIARGAQLDARDCYGSTPLMTALQQCNVPALRALRKAGADVQDRSTAGRHALMQEIRGLAGP
ncbi:hypothetical protein VTK56DRAFT_1192 [Thermocarpiscus australiensis]